MVIDKNFLYENSATYSNKCRLIKISVFRQKILT